jgi:hypothetical protein
VILNKLNIPEELRGIIAQELNPEESILWIEQPIPRFFFTESSIYVFWFGVFFTSGALFLTYGRIAASPTILEDSIRMRFILADLFFILIGFGLLSTPIWVKQRAKKRVYLVTNKRAITIQGGWFSNIISYFPEQLKNLYRKERNDGTGDVVIGTRIKRSTNSAGNSSTSIEEIGFMGVQNPQETEKWLQQLAQNTI